METNSSTESASLEDKVQSSKEEVENLQSSIAKDSSTALKSYASGSMLVLSSQAVTDPLSDVLPCSLQNEELQHLEKDSIDQDTTVTSIKTRNSALKEIVHNIDVLSSIQDKEVLHPEIYTSDLSIKSSQLKEIVQIIHPENKNINSRKLDPVNEVNTSQLESVPFDGLQSKYENIEDTQVAPTSNSSANSESESQVADPQNEEALIDTSLDIKVLQNPVNSKHSTCHELHHPAVKSVDILLEPKITCAVLTHDSSKTECAPFGDEFQNGDFKNEVALNDSFPLYKVPSNTLILAHFSNSICIYDEVQNPSIKNELYRSDSSADLKSYSSNVVLNRKSKDIFKLVEENRSSSLTEVMSIPSIPNTVPLANVEQRRVLQNDNLPEEENSTHASLIKTEGSALNSLSQCTCVENKIPLKNNFNSVESDNSRPDIPIHSAWSDEANIIERSKQIVSYRNIYKRVLGLKQSQQLFIPKEAILVNITKIESTPDCLLNPYLYSIEVKHRGFQWTVRRRYKHFQELHQHLSILKATLNFPSKHNREQKASLKHFRETAESSIKETQHFPKFPRRPEALVPREDMVQRKEMLQKYLQAVLDNQVYSQRYETLLFLEVSRMSFIDQLGPKRKEGIIRTRRVDTALNTFYDIWRNSPLSCLFSICKRIKMFGGWSQGWLFVKDTYIGYLCPKTGEINCILLMDRDFKVQNGTANTGGIKSLAISNLSRQIVVKDWTKRKAQEWFDAIENTALTTGKHFILPNRFASFSPMRVDSPCTWYVDGSDYMAAVADAIELAKEEIMIADWWLSPEIYLKRSVQDQQKWRLDTLLERKAEEGVRIFVLLYKEVEFALGINSLYSKIQMHSRHDNIKVLRHPDHSAGGVLFWAHHEKLVIIDQIAAFIGGIDLCYGRWDDEIHRLTDLGNEDASPNTINHFKVVQSSHTVGQQAPPTILQLAKAAKSVTVGTMSGNDTVSSYKTMVVERMRKHILRGREWANELKNKGRQFRGAKSTKDSIDDSDITKGKVFLERQNPECNDLIDNKLWIGKDYTNFIVKDLTNLDHPLKDTVDRSSTPRMPWHDIAISVTGPVARDTARHFIQRWNAVKEEKVTENPNFPLLVPKSYQEFSNLREFHFNKHTKVDCQLLRSGTNWSLGTRNYTEISIQKAYIDSIINAKHYVYIENQFFITLASHTMGSEVINEIGKALFDRIVRAHKESQQFRVYVVMPLLPGFEGQIGTATGIPIQAVLHWNYVSICRGKHSLMGKLHEADIEPNNYVSFCGLRNYSELNGQPVTELIYVHSKLMIVDDNLVICGSANINDRSMTGKRDSEVAVVINDKEFVDSIMNDQPYRAGKFALSLRKKLFREHLGISEGDDHEICDPVSTSFYKSTWTRIASLNTQIYEEVFRCLPADAVTSFTKLEEYKRKLSMAHTDPDTARKKLEEIQGYLVLLPLQFLSEESLTPATGTAESLLPTSLWI